MSREPLGPADVRERELRAEVVLDGPVDVLRLPGAERGDEAPEVLDDVVGARSGRRGNHGCSP